MDELTETDALVLRVMRAIAGTPGEDDGVDPDELFFFRHRDGRVVVAANCNDMFAYACADCEEITTENIEVFEKSVRNVVDWDLWSSYGELFAVRVRKQLPLKPTVWNEDNRRLWAMYEAEALEWAS